MSVNFKVLSIAIHFFVNIAADADATNAADNAVAATATIGDNAVAVAATVDVAGVAVNNTAADYAAAAVAIAAPPPPPPPLPPPPPPPPFIPLVVWGQRGRVHPAGCPMQS